MNTKEIKVELVDEIKTTIEVRATIIKPIIERGRLANESDSER